MKYKILTVLLLLAALSSGCGDNNKMKESNGGLKTAAETELEERTESTAETGTDVGTEPESGGETESDAGMESGEEPVDYDMYERESESGKVAFNCKIEAPDPSIKTARRLRVAGECYGDTESILSKYVEGKTVVDEYEEPAHNGIPDEIYYTMEDESYISVGYHFSYSSGMSKYYNYIGAANSENQEEYSNSGQVSFASQEDAVKAVEQELADIGFTEFDFQFQAYPVNHETMKKMEERYIDEGIIIEEKKKDAWTQEDDAYVVYGYQANDGLPVFHQWMTVYREWAYDNVDNAVVTAIYSDRGIEMLIMESVYRFEDTGEELSLKEFDEIAGIVEDKFENILNDAHYVVERAKLFQMVRMDDNQELMSEPIWYFEVVEDGNSRSITLVNAVTGKEIFLK